MGRLKSIRTSLLCALFAVASAHANVNIYEFLQKGKLKKVGIYEDCSNSILKHDLSAFKNDELIKQSKLIKELDFVNKFYHYTNSVPLKNILHQEEENREKAQEEIRSENGYASLLLYSMSSYGSGGGAAGYGFYLASNPLTSKGYGSIQVQLTLNPDARAYTGSVNRRISLANEAIQNLDLKGCDVFKVSLIQMQASGLDIHFYDKPREWFVLVNDEVIQQSQIIAIEEDLLFTHYARRNRLDEILRKKKNVSDLLWQIGTEKNSDTMKSIIRYGIENESAEILLATEASMEWTFSDERLQFVKELALEDNEKNRLYFRTIATVICNESLDPTLFKKVCLQ